MVGLLIATVAVSPVAFLAVGFYGVSRKRAEESYEIYQSKLPSAASGPLSVAESPAFVGRSPQQVHHFPG